MKITRTTTVCFHQKSTKSLQTRIWFTRKKCLLSVVVQYNKTTCHRRRKYISDTFYGTTNSTATQGKPETRAKSHYSSVNQHKQETCKTKTIWKTRNQKRYYTETLYYSVRLSVRCVQLLCRYGYRRQLTHSTSYKFIQRTQPTYLEVLILYSGVHVLACLCCDLNTRFV